MKKQLLFAAVAGMTLVSAHPPAGDQAAAPSEARSGYPPCSRTVTDRCIQLYERGVSAETASAHTAPAPSADDEDIDVAYAGETLQAPRAGHHPAHAAAYPPAHGPGPHHPPAQAAHAPPVHAAAAPRTYPPCSAGVTDRCSQQRSHQPRRQLAIRVRRAGERG